MIHGVSCEGSRYFFTFPTFEVWIVLSSQFNVAIATFYHFINDMKIPILVGEVLVQSEPSLRITMLNP